MSPEASESPSSSLAGRAIGPPSFLDEMRGIINLKNRKESTPDPLFNDGGHRVAAKAKSEYQKVNDF